LVKRFAPSAEGHGTDEAIDAFHNRRGVIPARVPLVKTIASALSIATVAVPAALAVPIAAAVAIPVLPLCHRSSLPGRALPAEAGA
jgi:H+/Cl- antiporter ClcA